MTTDAALPSQLGRVRFTPDGEITAGAYGTWQLSYQAGDQGVAADGQIRVYTDSDTDWEQPQMKDPAAADYLSVAAPAGVWINVVVQGWGALLLQVRGRGLSAGEQVTVTYGDRSGGGPGSRAQTFAEERRYFHVAVDARGDGVFATVPNSPYVTVAGDVVDHLLVVAPSTVTVGAPFRVQVQAKDRWGNAAAYFGTVQLEAEGIQLPQEQLSFGQAADQVDRGVYWLEGCVATEAGTTAIVARDVEQAMVATSNPIQSTVEAPVYELFWGDFHGGQVGNSTKIEEFFRYARDIAAIDFTSYQRNDHAISTQDWQRQQDAELAYDQPGRFIAIPGFEWSGPVPTGGHHNVFFRRHGQPVRRSSHRGLQDLSDIDTDLPHVLDLYAAYRGADLVITPHVGGKEADLTYHEPTLEPAIEITSTHGTFEWFLQEALERGYKVGFLGGSDSHTGRPGDDRPGFQYRRYAKSGLAGVYAKDLSLVSLLEALKARRCYATTGARIITQVSVDDHMLGEEFSTDQPPSIAVSVTGTAPLEAVELYRGLDCIYRHPIDLPVAQKSVRILWEGVSRRTCYAAVVWDGQVDVSQGQIKAVRPLRFDSPRCRVYDVMPGALCWQAFTCGHRSGLVIDLEGDDDLRLDLSLETALSTFPEFGGHGDSAPQKISYAVAESMACSFTLDDLAQGPQSFDLGIWNRKVTLSLAPVETASTTSPAGASHACHFTFVDPAPVPGNNPYWVRVVQTDMEMAWTSPVFIDYVAATR